MNLAVLWRRRTGNWLAETATLDLSDRSAPSSVNFNRVIFFGPEEHLLFRGLEHEISKA